MRKRSKKCLKMHVECTKRERRMSILLSDEEQLMLLKNAEAFKTGMIRLFNDERYLAKICETNIDNCCLDNYSSDFDLLYCGDCKSL